MNPNFPTSAFQSLTRATAKYNYIPPESTIKEESPKLPLKKGDLIYIIAKDPSNWWNGIILDTNTSRSGWFPASYVKVHDEEKNGNNRTSIINVSSKTSLEKLETISVAPKEADVHLLRDEGPKTPRKGNISELRKSTEHESKTSSPRSESADLSENGQQGRTKDALSEQLHGLRHSLSQLALTGLTSPRSSPSHSFHSANGTGDPHIPHDSPQAKDWKRKLADNGRVYYYNVRTDQTSWSAPDTNTYAQSPQLSIDSPEPITATLPRLSDWDNLVQNILMAIAGLNQDSKAGFKHKYLQHSTVTSINIRYMLKCCACLDKTSALLQQNRKLRRAHVTLFNSLTAFIRTVRVAVGVWPPPSAVNEMRKTAGDVLLHVREFVQTASAEKVPLILSPPHDELKELSTLLGPTTVVTFEDGQFKVVEMPESDAEVTEKLRFFLLNIQNDVEGLLNAIEHQESLASQDTQSLVKQVGDVIAYIEELQSKGTLPSSTDNTQVTINVLEEKQRLADSLHCTITSINAATKEFKAPFAIQQVIIDITILLTALKDSIIATKTYLEVNSNASITRPEGATGNRIRRSFSNGDSLNDVASLESPRARAATGSLPKIETNFRNLIMRNDTLLPSPQVNIMTPKSNASSIKSPLLLRQTELETTPEHTEPVTRSTKIRSLLGDQRLSGASGNSSSKPGSPASSEDRKTHSGDWFLKSQVDARDIVYSMDGDKRIKAATLEALIEYMCVSENSDPSFVTTILMTFRSFANPVSFLEQLVKQFHITPPEGLTKKEVETWAHSKQIPCQYKVCGILLQWIERNYIRKADFEMLPLLRNFIAQSLSEKFPQEMKDLNEVVKARLLDGVDRPSLIEPRMVKMGVSPPPILPKGPIHKLTDIDPIEIARQLTILDAAAFRAIEIHEWLTYKPSIRRRSLADVQAADDGGKIRRMITLSNKIAGWVAQTILDEPDIKKRCGLIKMFTRVAESCHLLHNFASRESILAGLQSSPIHRLKRTFEHVSSRTKTLIEQLTKHMDRDNNFKSYRDGLKRVTGAACVPFTGLYMTDLTFVLDGNPTLVYNDRLVNVEKFVKLGGILGEIRQFQKVNYSLVNVKEIQDFLDRGLSIARDADTLFDLSIEVEPREREDEKILRLLVEKGFG